MGLLRDWRAHRAFKQQSADWRRIVVYSESGQDWHHFERIIQLLTSRGERISYLTSDIDDPGLKLVEDNYRAFCVGSGLVRTTCFQFLEAGVMLMTMVDFNNLQLKRSIHPVRYAFMFHSLISVHMADHEDSYDHYDAVLCAGPHQMRELRKREHMLGHAPKQIFEHGYQRLEDLLDARRPPPVWQSDRDIHVLLAPSWGDETILNVCGEELVTQLINAGFRVTLRPHYQTRWNTPEVIDHITDKFGRHPQFSLMEHMAESDSLYDSHLMITDWSGAGMDYGMGLEKPVLYIDVPPKARNDWWPQLEMEPFEMYVRDKIGAVVSPESLVTVPQMIRTMLAEPDAFRRRVKELRNEWVFNFGDSVAAAADAVQLLAREADQGRAD